MRPQEISQQIHEENEKHMRLNLKKRRQIQKEHEKFKQEIINKHLEKIKQKELVEKKKEDLIEFSLMKQKELL